MHKESLKEKTAKGLFWGAINSGSTQLLNIIFGIFLARLLTPGDYGIVGMISIFTAIACALQDSGFSNALVNIKDIKDDDYNAVFWFNIIVSSLIYVILFFCAPLIAWYLHQDCLVELSRFVFLAFFISSFGIAQSAYLIRNMKNKEKAIIAMVSMIGSGLVGVVLAFLGFRYWSLAWQQVLFITITNIGRYHYSQWRPSWRINLRPIRGMFSFSYKILITTIVNTVSQNILSFIFGHLFKPQVVGNFTQANKWNNNASGFISGTIAQVAQPVLASIRDDGDREKRVFRKMLRFTAFLSFPAMFGLAMVGHEFIVTLISDRWADSVLWLQILCIGGAFAPIMGLYHNMSLSAGRSDIFMWCSIAQVVIQIIIVLTTHIWGIDVMVTSYTVFNVLWLIVWQHYAYKMIGVTMGEVCRDIAPSMIVAIVVMAVVYAVTLPLVNHNVVILLVRILLATALYAVIMKAAHVEMMDECLKFVRKKIKK